MATYVREGRRAGASGGGSSRRLRVGGRAGGRGSRLRWREPQDCSRSAHYGHDGFIVGAACHPFFRFSPPCGAALSTGRFTAKRVADRFLALTGERLVVKRSAGLDFLDLPESAFARTSGRYGEFQITVVDGGLADINAQLGHDSAGDTVGPDQSCVWWQRA